MEPVNRKDWSGQEYPEWNGSSEQESSGEDLEVQR